MLTTSVHQTPSAIPATSSPRNSNTPTAGTQTSAAPTPGTADRMAMMTLQKIGPGMPTTANAAPASAPCMTPTTRVTFSVARVIDTPRSMTTRRSVSVNGV